MQPRPTTVADSRRQLADRVASGLPTPVPLCLDALGARLAEQLGYHAGYVSGGAIGFAKAVSEGLLAFSELAEATASLTLRCNLPIIVDGAVGFGDPVHVTRMMWEFEAAGAAAVELEDQVAPKRVSHHRGIEHLVGTEEMAEKIAAAVAARQNPRFLVIARTAALRHEGAAAACARARAYVEAGADVILIPLPYADGELEQVRQAVDVPLATIGLFDHAADAYARGVTLFIDSITPHAVTFAATRELLRRHQEGLPSGMELADIMANYRALGEVGGLEGLYDIERATTERGT
jgi:2-methylisocitrate lyase-like PEP mutase family enzyme